MCVCVCLFLCVFLEGSEKWARVFATRPKHQGIHDFNALNNNEIVLNNTIISCVVTNTMFFDAKEKRIQSVFNDEHVSVCSALLCSPLTGSLISEELHSGYEDADEILSG